ncbi:MAG: hypothetical protein WCJ84_03155 [Candidatus Peregrinibacteria bacterium]
MTLYLVSNDDLDDKIPMDSFIFCGKNWDWYFTEKPENYPVEVFENCIFSKEYPDGIEDVGFIDYDRDQGIFLFFEKYIPENFPKEKLFNASRDDLLLIAD